MTSHQNHQVRLSGNSIVNLIDLTATVVVRSICVFNYRKSSVV